MAQISVNGFSKFDNYETMMNSAEKELRSIAGEIYSVRKNLRSGMLMKSYTSICRSIDNTKQSVENCRTKVGNLRTGAEKIETLYRNAENQLFDAIKGKSLITEDVQNLGGGGSSFDSDDSDTQDLSDSMKWWSKLLKAAGKITDGDSFGTIGSGLALFSGVLTVLGTDYTTYLEFLEDYIGTVKDAAGFSSKLLKLFDYDKAGGRIGTGSSFLGIVKEWIEGIQKSPDEALKNAGGLIDSAGDFTTGLYSLIYPEYFKTLEASKGKTGVYLEKVGNVSAVCSLFTMASMAVGDVMSFTKDGDYTWDEFVDTAWDVSFAGADSLISGLTYGVIDIDADAAIDTFQSNSKNMSQWISDTGLPLSAQVALGVVTAPAGALVSAAEVVIDTLEDTVEKAANLVSWVGSWFK